ncbi:MAG: NADP-dependent oxidoreductase [Dehalococcoidia bacterium]
MAKTTREIHLAKRPEGVPDDSTFELVETPMPEPADGEVLVQNLYMSVDPAMRGRMNGIRTYVQPFELGEPLTGGAIGRVVESRDGSLATGDLVQNGLGWREHFVAPASTLAKLEPGATPLTQQLGVLGGTGFTAYVGMLDIGQPKAGETVFVSGAAGAVGSVAGQIAKIEGCRVIGSAGSDEKIDWLTRDLGFDAAFNYKTSPPAEALAEAAPDGIDVYFDNVGYDHLEAAITHMNDFGRIAACGSISGYNSQDPAHPRPGPDNLAFIVRKRLRMRGFIVSDHADRRADFRADMERWLAEGAVRSRETVLDGIEQAPAAFMGLFNGTNTGKMLVQLAPEG